MAKSCVVLTDIGPCVMEPQSTPTLRRSRLAPPRRCSTGTAIFRSRTSLKRPGEALPDVDELNAQIPRSEWKEGLDGQPRPPWQHAYVAYLVSVDDASLYTFVNGTIGARIAVERLQDKVKWMRALRGVNCAPLVRLDSKLMKTRFAELRPEFTLVEWRQIGGGGLQARQIEQRKPNPAEQIGRPVKPDHDRRKLNDRIRF